jgi:deoxyribonuclease-4
MTKKLLVGAHMSISGGPFNALLHGEELGCTTIQIFTKNSNQWRAKLLTSEDARKFREAQKRTGISPVVGHNAYLINLASPKEDIYRQSLEAMLVELKRAEFLGLPYLVMHPGAHLGSGEKEGIGKIARSLDRLHEKTVGFEVKICLETTAGQGSSIGYRFEHLVDIIGRVKEKGRLGVCYDTCHTFAAGYDIRTQKTYETTLKEFDNVVGLSKLWVIHVNDSLKDLGSQVDRHQHLGEGKIGLEGFRLLMNDKRWEEIPKILETPKEGGTARDIANLNLVRGLAN